MAGRYQPSAIGHKLLAYVDDIARGTLAALKPMGYEVINEPQIALITQIEVGRVNL